MIDIHCHILPEVDDGPKTLEESIILAKEAVKEGITSIIATPHHRNNKYDNTKTDIISHVGKFNEILVKEDIPLSILPGQETRIFGEVIEDYRNGEILTLANTKYLFIEFPSSSVPKFSDRLLYDIQLEGLTPIIVHPERNKEILENPNILYNLVKNGALSQITAASLVGYFGKATKNLAKQLIENNLTHFIASDAHNTVNRTFKLSEAYEQVHNEYGLDYFHLFTENTELLLMDNNIIKEIPEPIRRKKLWKIF